MLLTSSLSSGGTDHHWEGWLIEGSFIGLGLGLAGALPLYLRRRWAAGFTGRLDRLTPAADAWLRPAGRLTLAATSGALLLAVTAIFWAAGGQLGLRHPEARDYEWRLQLATVALWSVVGAWGAWSLRRGRPSTWPVWLPVTLTWLASGYLFAWSVWKLPFTAYLAVVSSPTHWPEQLGIAAAENVVGAVTGVILLLLVLRVAGNRVR
jgi:hypothetical protein